MGKEKFEEVLGDLIIKPSGKPTLVPESDKRKSNEYFKILMMNLWRKNKMTNNKTKGDYR